ncbi:MAG TPA: putative lipid II flippase FtsW [Nevskiaceae bacterium]|nr:putative lipid II flippase FtsW [Nevskiaceae bacterium]
MSEALATARRERLDGWLCLSLAALLGWGLVMVASASVDIARKSYGSPFYFFDHQLIFMAFGLALAGVAFAVPMRFWQQRGFWLLALSLLALAIVLVPGIGLRVNDSRRWLNLGLFRVQASEPARLMLLVYLAGYIVRRQARLQHSLLGLLPVFLPLLFAAFLMLAEPDFGAASIFMIVAVLMLFLGGARVRDMLGIGVLLVVAMGLLAIAAPYRMERLMSFLDPWAHANNTGFQLVQSLIAIGRGQWFGVGLGASVEKLLYLPEMHTDFIFAILAEELGLVGVGALLLLYATLVWRGFVIGRRAERLEARFEAYLCYGLSTWLGIQALVNMAVNMGLLPTKGLTLPFISYGGSSLITALLVAALLLRVDYETRGAGRASGRLGGHAKEVEGLAVGGNMADRPRARTRPGPMPAFASFTSPLRALGGRLFTMRRRLP